MNRTMAIVSTIASVLLCGCPGLFLCAFGAAGVAGLPVTTTLNDSTNTAPMATSTAVALLCASIVLILIPVVVGFLTLRKKAAAPVAVMSEPMPPAS